MPPARIAEQQVTEESGGGAVREVAIGTHGLSPPTRGGRFRDATGPSTEQGTATGGRAWRYVLTQGFRALVRRDRRREFLAPGDRFGSPGDSGGTAPDSHRLPLLPP
ncbi:hypothetical protein GCM10010349_34190 [Streptomyces flavofungini]|nr:hypothetical protein GCM10010349_34190 [Streptomyces flavofungini]